MTRKKSKRLFGAPGEIERLFGMELVPPPAPRPDGEIARLHQQIETLNFVISQLRDENAALKARLGDGGESRRGDDPMVRPGSNDELKPTKELLKFLAS